MSPHFLLRTSLLSFLCGAMITATCAAQGRSQFGQTGASGMGQQGQSAFGGGGQMGRGQSRGGGAGFGQNAFGGAAGGNAFGGGGFGGTGPQPTGTNQPGVGAQGGFLGGDAQQTQNFFRSMNGGQRRTAMFDFMIENLNDMRESRGRGGREGRDSAPPVRVKLRPAFETPLSTIQQVSVELQSRLASSVDDLGVTNPRITMEGRTLTLEGKVATEHQRALVEKMASLEPGVTSIDNRITVETPLPPQD